MRKVLVSWGSPPVEHNIFLAAAHTVTHNGGHIDMFFEIVQGFLALASPAAIATLLALPPAQPPSIEEVAFVPRRPHTSYYLLPPLPHPLAPPAPAPSAIPPPASRPSAELDLQRPPRFLTPTAAAPLAPPTWHLPHPEGAGSEDSRTSLSHGGPTTTTGSIAPVPPELSPPRSISAARGEAPAPAPAPSVSPLVPGILRALGLTPNQRGNYLARTKRPGSPLRRFASGKKSEHITDQERLTE